MMDTMFTMPDLNNGFLVYIDKKFYNKKQSDKIYKKLIDEIQYDENSIIKIMGKEIAIPRKQTAYGDPGMSYSFSGTRVNAKSWLPFLLKIKDDIELQTNEKFNFCLVNYYENGNNYIGYHSDDEKELGKEPSIVSISFGATRKFYFKSKIDKNLPVKKISLNHGCLCYIMHPTNKYWKHSVPKEPKIDSPRINLTFRYIYD